MPTTYPNIGLTLPTRGAPGSGVWGDTEDANWALVDAHSHQPGKGLPITTAAISINADLPFSALWAPTQLHRVQFSNIAGGALSAGQRTSLFTSDGTSGLVANELYWHNSSGNKVQITSGNTLNFAAFVGGIGQDYTSVGATLNYNDGQKAYEFKEGTVDSHGWARLRTGDVRLFPFNTTGAVFVGMAAPGGIAGSYTVTWPLALPGTTALQQIDNTGQVIFSNTVPNAVTFSSSVTLAANQSITVSGTGDVKHGTRTLQIGHTIWQNTGGTTLTFVTGTSIVASGTTMLIECAVPLKAGDRITAIRFTGSDSATGPTKFQGGFGPYAGAAAGTTANSAGTGATQTLPITSGLPFTIAAGTPIYMTFATSAGSSNTQFRFVEIDYDRP